ncbi:MAG: DinB family protein [bacterium]
MTSSSSIPADRFTTAFFRILEEAFERHHGIFLDKGTSLFETLDRVSAEQASRPVSEGRPTIAAQVDHVRFYLDVIDRYLRGQSVDDVDWNEIWRTTKGVTPAEWAAMKGQLRESHDRVCQLLRGLSAWDDDDSIRGALAVLVHSAYHLGQIRLTVRALGVEDR